MLPNTTSSPCLYSQHPFMCPHQPAHESVGTKVPSDQVPQVHLHHLHPKLPWPEPAHHLCLFGGRDEGSVHRPAGLWWHEPQSWRCESCVPYVCRLAISVNECCLMPQLLEGSQQKFCLVCFPSELEWRLSETGAVKTDLEENPRKQIEDKLMSSIRSSIPTRKDSDSEDD